MTDIVKKTAIRKHAGPLNVGSEFYEAFDDRVKELIDETVRVIHPVNDNDLNPTTGDDQ